MMKKITSLVCVVFMLASSLCVSAKELGSAQYIPYEWKPVTIGAGGVISDYFFHPKVQGLEIVRGDVGGAWLRNHSDERWENISNFDWNQVLYFGCDGIAIDPENPDIIYYAAGKYDWANASGTVLKSTDRGKTWENTGFNKKAFKSNAGQKNGDPIIIDPANTNIIYVGTYNGHGLWRSKDAAETWEKVSGLPVDAKNTARIFILDPTSVEDGMTKRIYAYVSSQGLYVTEDGAETWNKMEDYPGMSARQMSISNDGTLVIACSSGVFKYKDGVWSDISDIPGSEYRGVAISPTDSNMIVAVRKSHANIMQLPVLLSEDGGETWFNTTAEENVIEIKNTTYSEDDAFASSIQFIKMNPHNPKEVVIGDWHGLSRTYDITAKPQVTWEDDNLGIEELCVTYMLAHEDAPYHLYTIAMDNDGFAFTQLDDFQERKFSDIYGTYGGMRMMTVSGFDVCYSEPKYVVRTGVSHHDWATASYSEDGGVTWKNFETNPVTEVANRDGTRVRFSSNVNEETGKPAHTIIFRSGKNPLVSDDMGITWTEVEAPAITTYGFQNGHQILEKDYELADTFYFYDHTKGQFWRSTDGGYKWDKMCSFDEVPSSQGSCRMTAIPGSPGEVWFATGSSLVHEVTGSLYRTTDGFETIEPVQGFKDVLGVCYGKAAHGRENVSIYVIGKRDELMGMYRSTDEGKNWNLITNNVPGAFWNEPSLLCGDMHDFGVVYVAGGGSGMFYGKPEGTEMTDFSTASEDSEAPSEILLSVNGNQSSERNPVYKNGVLYYSARTLYEMLGADVKWKVETQTVDIQRQVYNVHIYGNSATGSLELQSISLAPGSNTIQVNGEALELESCIINLDGKVYVPLEEIIPLWQLELKVSEENEYQITDRSILVD